ncbi:MAG: T9SS type A sorting domain-containing protein, partial [Taibaiella sp.]|nr:T9SS type A sorting domain-containing protein [Taibaiella sp.]
AYWYFDGHNGNICHYDFATPHIVGGDDHSDGKVRRYSDVTVTREPNVPSHMAFDKQNNWLYIVDGGANRVIRMKTNSGTIGNNLTPYAEPLAEFKEVTGATQEVMVSSGLTSPCGIDYRNGRIIVSDNATGNIHIYNVTTTPATSVGTIITGGPGVMGVKITDDNKIWYVNSTTKTLNRIDNPNVVSVEEVAEKINYTVYPNPANNILNIRMDDITGTDQATIRIFDVAGRQVYNNVTSQQITTVNTAAWAKGMYNVVISYKNIAEATKVMVQ